MVLCRNTFLFRTVKLSQPGQKRSAFLRPIGQMLILSDQSEIDTG